MDLTRGLRRVGLARPHLFLEQMQRFFTAAGLVDYAYTGLGTA